MKIIFFGTSSFATYALLALSKSKHKLLAVVTQPDRRSGRGLVRNFSPAKLIAQKYGLALYQPTNVNNSDFIKTLEQLKPDLFVVSAFGQILSKEVLKIPKLYSINIHASLLPKYRGAAPINWALLNDEKITGITIFRMTKGMDEGDIIAKKEIIVSEEDTAPSLGDKLSKVGADLLIETLGCIESGKTEFIPQNKNDATYAPKLEKKDGVVSWNETSRQIYNRVRGMIPWPTAYAHLDNKLIKIWKAKVLTYTVANEYAPGTIINLDKNGIAVKTKDGALLICELQTEGSKKMPADAYCRGHKLEIGKKFS